MRLGACTDQQAADQAIGFDHERVSQVGDVFKRNTRRWFALCHSNAKLTEAWSRCVWETRAWIRLISLSAVPAMLDVNAERPGSSKFPLSPYRQLAAVPLRLSPFVLQKEAGARCVDRSVLDRFAACEIRA